MKTRLIHDNNTFAPINLFYKSFKVLNIKVLNIWPMPMRFLHIVLDFMVATTL